MTKKYNPQNIECKWYDYWMKNNIFHSEPSSKQPYTILIPPPNVTGVLHMGHMLNNTIQDVLIRRARLLGFNACWIPGTDHASIATEAKVIQKLKDDGISKDNLSRKQFLQHAWEWTEKHGGIILKQLKRLGVSCDWERLKFTMDTDMSETVIEAFVKLYDKGLIYRGNKMINWDPKAKTAVSDEEVIYKDQNSSLYYVDYKILDSQSVITVATTRPETILGDTAICVNPNDKRYSKLIGSQAIVPLINRVIPIIADEYIDPEFGTGALKVTPAHDINDYEIGKKNDLEIISVIDEDGLMHRNAKLYIGEDRFDVRKKIIEDIADCGQLNKIESIQNKVGFSERTDVVIEPRLSTQWFMKMEKLAEPALEAVVDGSINFYPKKTIKTYKYWMENIRDWCISRQLWWGHQIPVYYYNELDYVVAKDKDSALLMAQKKAQNPDLKLSDLRQDEDVLDTWFSSWLWPISVFDGLRNPDNKDFNYYYSTDDLVTGPDILFFWVARMIMAGYEFKNNPPFKNVYFTGIVRDKKRRKMSKSLGNSPDPIKLINEYGADGVRTAMLFASPAGNDLLFDESLCEQGRNFSNKIWNAHRLIDSWNPSDSECNQIEKAAIKWFGYKLTIDISKLNKLFDEFRISDCLMILYKLIWDDFCSSYLELIKPSGTNVSLVAKQKTIEFFDILLTCLHPFMPFITEEIWQKIKHRAPNDSISFTQWPDLDPNYVDQDILSQFNHLFQVVAAVRKIRKDKNIPFKESLNLFYEDKNPIAFSEIIKKMCNVNKVELLSGDTSNLFPFLVGVCKYYIPVNFKIDTASEITKINEKIKYLNGFLNSIEKKLSNTSFISNAPQKVIDIELQKKNDTINKLASLEEQLNTFNESS